MATNYIPDSYKIIYTIDEVKKTFVQFKILSAEKNLLSDIVRLERNNGFNSISGANLLLRIRNASNWTKCSISGLRPTQTPGYYYSDLPINGVKSLCVVKYNSEIERLEIKVCRQFYPYNASERFRIVKKIIQLFNT